VAAFRPEPAAVQLPYHTLEVLRLDGDWSRHYGSPP